MGNHYVDGRDQPQFGVIYKSVVLSPNFIGSKTRPIYRPLGRVAVLLYLYISTQTSHKAADGVVQPHNKSKQTPVERIATDLKTSKASVFRAINELVANRLLEVTRTNGASWYRLVSPPGLVAPLFDSRSDSRKSATIVTDRGSQICDTRHLRSATSDISDLRHNSNRDQTDSYLVDGKPTSDPVESRKSGTEPQLSNSESKTIRDLIRELEATELDSNSQPFFRRYQPKALRLLLNTANITNGQRHLLSALTNRPPFISSRDCKIWLDTVWEAFPSTER